MQQICLFLEEKTCRVCKKSKHKSLFEPNRKLCKKCRNRQITASRKPKLKIIHEIPQGLPADEYFAGFFDGEGCIGIRSSYSTSLYLLQLSVVNTNGEVIRLFRKRFGGTWFGPRSRGSRWKPIYRWKAEAATAEHALIALTPHLIVKRRQAELAIKFRELFRGGNILPRGKGVEFDPKKRERILLQRRECYSQMRKLNHRGI